MTSRIAALLGALALIGLAACESPRMTGANVGGDPLLGNLPAGTSAACAIAAKPSMEVWAPAIRWLNQPGRPHALPLHGPIYIWAAERHLENGECFGRSPQASAGSARETKSEEGAVIEEPESSL